MKRFVLCAIFSVLIIGLSTLVEARNDGRHGGGGGSHKVYRSGGGSHQGYRGGYRGYYGGHPRYYGGYSYYYTYPFGYGSGYYAPGYYSYPAPVPQDVPPIRCQILENGEWKDIPCR